MSARIIYECVWCLLPVCFSLLGPMAPPMAWPLASLTRNMMHDFLTKTVVFACLCSQVVPCCLCVCIVHSEISHRYLAFEGWFAVPGQIRVAPCMSVAWSSLANWCQNGIRTASLSHLLLFHYSRKCLPLSMCVARLAPMADSGDKAIQYNSYELSFARLQKSQQATTKIHKQI